MTLLPWALAAAGWMLTLTAITPGDPPASTSSLGTGLLLAPDDRGAAQHEPLFDEQVFPSASECATCHPEHYREWSVSPHAYAQISPIFNAFASILVTVTNGTLGDFCFRCHTQVGMSMGEPVVTSNLNRSEIALEGVTCVVCHRVDDAYGKISGRLPLRPGDLLSPIVGPHPDDELRRVLSSPEEYQRVVTEPGVVGRRVHAEARQLTQMSSPGFCGRCHDVRLVDGFRLEDAFSEYKQSPAAAKGETCQDCHMGPESGVAGSYPDGPAAIIGGVPTRPTRRTNHMFVGPDTPIVHPGIFPHNPEAKSFASPMEWVSFDHEAGWGTDEFEDQEPDDSEFPERWASIDDRYDARDILEAQLELLAAAQERGTVLLENGYALSEIEPLSSDSGLAFEVSVSSTTYGHNAPTGLSAERTVFLRVTVKDAEGTVVFRSGDSDPNGDLRDIHSAYVHDGVLPLDEQLFNLRSPFVARNVRGSEREQVFPANYSFDPLLFVRPSSQPSLLLGGIRNVRLQKMSLPPGASRAARYHVTAAELTGLPPYRVDVQLVAGMVPVHLVKAIAPMGFDYGLSPRDVGDAVAASYRVLWERTLSLEGNDR